MFHTCNTGVYPRNTAYQALIRPLLEYAPSVWGPHQDIYKQVVATNYVPLPIIVICPDPISTSQFHWRGQGRLILYQVNPSIFLTNKKLYWPAI